MLVQEKSVTSAHSLWRRNEPSYNYLPENTTADSKTYNTTPQQFLTLQDFSKFC
jgi:hypothetical protein